VIRAGDRNGDPEAGITLSLVIPAFREAARLGPSLQRVARWLEAWGQPAEVVVVDDGSRDETAEVARAHAPLFARLRVLRHAANRGKGAAVRTGVLAAQGRLVAFADADLAAPIEALSRLLAALERGADVAVASRRTQGADIARQQPLARRVAGHAFRGLVRAIVPTGVSDTQCGLKAFRREAARHLASRARLDGWAFDVEWLARARRSGMSVAEVPVRWSDDPRSALVLRRAAVQMLRDLLRARLDLAREAPGGRLARAPSAPVELATAADGA
jgi:dolichyl-phosphate beta-glucosyltransferase